MLAALCSCSGPKETAQVEEPPTLTPLWELSGPFTSPESAIYDARRDVIYVSNVAGYTENGLGYISAVSADGSLVEERWLEGINAPTGMTIDGDTLYVADYNRLLEIDVSSASVRQIHNAPDENPGLNDVTISADGDVFVSASAISTVYRLTEEGLTPWAQSDELRFANGLLADEAVLYVAGFYLRTIDLKSKEISPFGDEAVLQDLESIETDGRGGFFVSLIGNAPIMHVSKKGETVEILARDVYTADVDFIPQLKMLVGPGGGEALYAFGVE